MLLISNCFYVFLWSYRRIYDKQKSFLELDANLILSELFCASSETPEHKHKNTILKIAIKMRIYIFQLFYECQNIIDGVLYECYFNFSAQHAQKYLGIVQFSNSAIFLIFTFRKKQQKKHPQQGDPTLSPAPPNLMHANFVFEVLFECQH